MSAGDAVIRALGADPAVYRPILRAQSRIISRRTRLARATGRVKTKGITPFQIRCFIMAVLSLMMLQWIVGSASPIFGVALILTAGAGFLVVDFLFDKFDLLADAGEYQVIAAHPHDAWSVILAKIAAIGRSIVALAACLFLAPAVGVGIAFHSIGAGLAFAAATAALTIVVSAGGIVASALVIAWGGRQALLRLLPVAQITYLFFYLGVIATRQELARISMPRLEALGWLQWALPTVWFAAPVEVASGHVGAAVIGRGSLAIVSIGVLLPLSAQWVRTRFDERVLEPVRRKPTQSPVPSLAPTRTRRVAVSSSVRSDRAIGMRAFWRLLVAHFRSDTAVRGGMLMAIFFPTFMLVGQSIAMRASLATSGFVWIVSWLMMAEVFAVNSTTMSSRPAAIWFVLAAPRARVPYTRALEAAVRLGVILPGVALAAVYTAMWWAEPVWIRAAFVALVAIVGDSSLLFLRVMNPYLPFSRPPYAHNRITWRGILLTGALIVFASVLFVAFVLLEHWRPIACLIPLIYGALAWVPLMLWAKSCLERNAREIEAV